MASQFTRKTPKSEAAYTSPFTYHDMIGSTSVLPNPRWYDRDYITCISIDPGIVNLCIRIERRPIRGPLTKVKVLHHENISFKKYGDINSTASIKQTYTISQLYGEVTRYIGQFHAI
jgi:hypothetical protein